MILQHGGVTMRNLPGWALMLLGIIAPAGVVTCGLLGVWFFRYTWDTGSTLGILGVPLGMFGFIVVALSRYWAVLGIGFLLWRWQFANDQGKRLYLGLFAGFPLAGILALFSPLGPLRESWPAFLPR
jgi:hypothetical protein